MVDLEGGRDSWVKTVGTSRSWETESGLSGGGKVGVWERWCEVGCARAKTRSGVRGFLRKGSKRGEEEKGCEVTKIV
jgi:hypothetical protein